MTLIGATTENPYFEVNSALLSRCQIYELEPLAPRGRSPSIVRRGAAELGVERADELVDADRAAGRRRRARGAEHPRARRRRRRAPRATRSAERHVEDAARKRPLVYDKSGDAHYDFTSAFIKSMRGSDPDAALYYLAAMLEGGEDPRFLARRMVIFASEDVGNADPARAARRRRGGAGARARRPAGGAAQPRPGGDLPRAGAEVERRHHRARRGDAATCASTERSARRRRCATPTTAGAKQLGHGEGYVYPHDDPRGLRGRSPAGGAARDALLPAVRERRGSGFRVGTGRLSPALQDPGAERARDELDGEPRGRVLARRGSG